MAELWVGYQHEYEFQQNLYKAHLTGPFKDKAVAVGKALEKLQTVWKKLGDDQVFFLQFYVEDASSQFFIDSKSLVDTPPYGLIPDLHLAADTFTKKLNMAVADLKAGRGTYFNGNVERYANKWLVRRLLSWWAEQTKETPRKYEDNPAVIFVERTVNQLISERWDDTSPAALELKAFTNVGGTCEQIIKSEYRKKRN